MWDMGYVWWYYYRLCPKCLRKYIEGLKRGPYTEEQILTVIAGYEFARNPRIPCPSLN